MYFIMNTIKLLNYHNYGQLYVFFLSSLQFQLYSNHSEGIILTSVIDRKVGFFKRGTLCQTSPT